jgi:ATP-dependent DNA helicase MPH1
MLANLAQVMAYLVSQFLFLIRHNRSVVVQLEGTVSMAFTFFQDVSAKDSDDHATRNQQVQSKKLRESELYKMTIGAFEAAKETPTGPFLLHPKMDKTVRILVDYFAQRLPESDNEDGGEAASESKAMVFVTYRPAVDEMVEVLNAHRPIIRASRFIGQGSDKHGKKGTSQKEQLEVYYVYLWY